MSGPFRLPEGGSIDRTRPLRFRFDGHRYSGYAGDTLASALLANGVRVVGRSFKYHRPRGLLAAGPEEPNGLVRIGDGGRATPNVRATEVRLVDGLEVRSQNCWPSARLDLARMIELAHRIMPPGFYHKTFTWPSWASYEGLIRRGAGLGRAPREPDADWYCHRNLHCDVLVIGAGPAGLAAASAAVDAGADTVVVDEHAQPGGSLAWETELLDGAPGIRWAAATVERLARGGRCRVLASTCVTGAYDSHGFTATETCREGQPRERLWTLRARAVVLATGALERPLVFPGNDLPGLMLGAAAREYLGRYAVVPGRRIALVTNNESAYRTLPRIAEAGLELVGVIDLRDAPGNEANGVATGKLWPSCVVTNLRRRLGRLHASIASHARGRVSGADRGVLSCDAVLSSGGWSPLVHLAAQAGAPLRFDPGLAAFVVEAPPPKWQLAGSVRGAASAEECRAQGREAGSAAARHVGLVVPTAGAEAVTPPAPVLEMAGQSAWFVEFSDERRHRRQWVDLQYDVTVDDIRVALRENYSHVELMKRYTGAGTAPDQGKTGQVNARGVMAALTGRSLDGARITTLRPPYRPVTLGAIAGYASGALYRAHRNLPAHELHGLLGARFDEYGEWQRPAFYPREGETDDQAIEREVIAARTDAAVLDGSSLAKIEVLGRDAASFLDRVFVNNIGSLAVGRIRYAVMLDEGGTVRDDGVVARLATNHFLVNSTSARASAMVRWLERLKQCEWPELDVTLIPVTEQWATFAVSGPRSAELLDTLGLDPAAMVPAHMTVGRCRVGSVEGRVCRVSFTGELTYEVSVPAGHAQDILEALLREHAGKRATPIGIEALGILRTEKGYLHVGTDTDSATTADDIGLRPVIDRKAGDFIGRRSLERVEQRREDRRQLVGLAIAGSEPAPAGAHVLRGGADRASIGNVTSGCWSPTLLRPIAIGLVSGGRARIGQAVTVWSEDRTWQATVASLPFVDPKGERLRG